MPNPYVFGPPVTGNQFYGAARRRLLEDIRDPDNAARTYAIFGLRRYGKSSFLAELARIIDPTALCVQWNLSGCDDPAKAFDQLCSGLPSDVQLATVGLTYDAVENSGDLFKALRLLTRATAEHERRLWLLCDECDSSLRHFRTTHPGELARLRGALVNRSHVRVIVVGARPLSDLTLAEGAEEPFLSGFQLRYLPPLSPDDITELAARSTVEGGPPLDAAHLFQHTAGHPFLAQGLCLRLFSGDAWEQAYNFVAAHHDVRSAFDQDYQFLSEGEQQASAAVSAAGTLAEDEALAALPHHLRTERGRQQFLAGMVQSGYLTSEAGQYRLANTFFAAWLKDSAAALPDFGSQVQDHGVQVVADRLPTEEAAGPREILLLHISDLHFDDPIGRGKDAKDNVHRYRQGPVGATPTLEQDLVEDLAERLKVLPDFVVVSGDLTCQSVSGGFTEAEKCLLRLRAMLAEKFAAERFSSFARPSKHEQNRWGFHKLGATPSRLYDVERLLVVPGNHDIGWKPTVVTMEEDHYRSFYLNVYGKNANASLMHVCYDSELDVALVGFNSARLEPTHHGLGYVDLPQVQQARQMVRQRRQKAARPEHEDSTLRIAVVHHHLVQVIPTQYEEFKDGHFGVMMNAEEVIRQLMRERFSLVLHGHQHMPFVALERRFFPGQGKDAVASSSRTLGIIGAGSVGIIHQELTKGYGRNHYNLIAIRDTTARVEWQCASSPTGDFKTEDTFVVPITRP